MGCKHSTPAPQEDDWLYVHGPPSRALSRDLAPKRGKGEAREFNVKKNVWNEKASINLQEGLLKAVPHEDPNSMIMVLVQEDSDTTNKPVVVLKVGQGKTIQVCSLTQAKRDQSSCGQYKGFPLYKWAVVTKLKESNQFNMITVADKVTYESEYYGSLLGKRKLVLMRQGLVCASMARCSETDQYKCCVGPGIDPVLIVSFLLSMNKIQAGEMKTIQDAVMNVSSTKRVRPACASKNTKKV